jgi:hypothetical protein
MRSFESLRMLARAKAQAPGVDAGAARGPSKRIARMGATVLLQSLLRFVTGAVVFALVLWLTGCATPAESVSMVARPTSGDWVTTPTPLRNNVAIRDVTGGKDTNPMWTSQVGSSEFEKAIEDSLRAAALLSPNRYVGTHQLIAHLEKFDTPPLGLDITATAAVGYQLLERATGRTVFEKTIELPYTAKFGDAFVFAARSRAAAEGAIRTNIAALIEELLKLKLEKTGDPPR